MSPEDWSELRGQDRRIDWEDWSCQPFDSPFDWFVADTLTIDGVAYEQARIRKKGFIGSLSTSKPALKLRLDKDLDQDHFGTARITLNNSIQDQSMVNTCLVYKVFRDAGLPAPLCNYAHVTVNDEDLGRYINVEDMKTDFFERAFNGKGDLYEGTMSDFLPDLTGTFEKKTNKNDKTGMGYIARVTEAIERNDVAAMNRLIDANKFLTFWALEGLLGMFDGYTHNINNYYVHESEDGLVFIPWGADDAFIKPKIRVMHIRSAVARALFPSHLDAYKRRMLHLLDTVWDEIALLGYVSDLAESAGRNADTLRVAKFIVDRREHVEARIARADFTKYYHATSPHEGDCPHAAPAAPGGPVQRP